MSLECGGLDDAAMLAARSSKCSGRLVESSLLPRASLGFDLVSSVRKLTVDEIGLKNAVHHKPRSKELRMSRFCYWLLPDSELLVLHFCSGCSN